MKNYKRVIFSIIILSITMLCTILFFDYTEKAASSDVLKAKIKCEYLAKQLNTTFVYDKNVGCAIKNYFIVKF